MKAPAKDYVAIANDYMRRILSGEEPACSWVRFACQRQADDLEREINDPAWPFRFDVAAATRVCRFMEKLPHIKGPLARKRVPLTLEPWQCFVYVTAYGWLWKESPLAIDAAAVPADSTNLIIRDGKVFNRLAGKRRFRSIYLEVPRGNGKSFMLSGGCLYALAADGEEGAEVYSAATTKDQAKIVFDSTRKMAMNTPDLRAALGIGVAKAALVVERSASSFKPLSSDEDSLEGLNIHFVAIDELHAHKRRAVYDVCESGMGKRDQPMMWIITTAGSDRAGICYEVRGYVLKVLNRTAIDETWFGMIFTIDRDEMAEEDDDKGDDWRLEASWRKANPNWNVSVEPNHIARMATKAMQLPASQANFKTKHLNVWVNADSAWLDMRHWHRCKDETLRIADFEGQESIVALDLASKIDIAARLNLFWKMMDTKLADGRVEPREHYFIFSNFYLPQVTIEEASNSQYLGWREAGLLTETAGEVIDYSVIEADVKDDCETYSPAEVVYDPWQATQMAQNLQLEGIQIAEYRPTVANFSEPMKSVQALAIEGRLHHDGNPIMAWMMSNVVCHRDAKDNIFPRKERDENKIDGSIALIMAIGRRLHTAATPAGVVYFV